MSVSSIPLTEVEAWELMALDEGLDPQCESGCHESGRYGHSGDATHMQFTRCGHRDGLRCSGYVYYVRSHLDRPSRCDVCDAVGPCTDIRFIPLPVGGSHE